MFPVRRVVSIVAGGLALGLCPGLAQAAAPLQREANTTLTFPHLPPTFGYFATNAFGNLTFINPIHIIVPPGETNRIFILERAGRVTVVANLAAPTRTVFMDISNKVRADGENGLLGMAFHPGYATNRFFYLFYSLTTTTTNLTGTLNANRLHQRVSRFEISPVNPNAGLVNTELPLITQSDDAGNHNGGDIAFGPDGYLYIAVGDEGGANDNLNNSQTIDQDFYSGILRLDVDRTPGSRTPRLHSAHRPSSTSFSNPYEFRPDIIHYTIPPDNPFIGATVNPNGTGIVESRLREEFWAVGLRNPFRMRFDEVTGALLCGDVGQAAWEEINLITRGGNYGWAFREGFANGPKAPFAPPGFSSIPPIIVAANGLGTNQGRAIIAGVIYRGANIPMLTGKYVFGDNTTGNIWTATLNGTNTVPFERILGVPAVAAIGTDPRNGDVLFAGLISGVIWRLQFGQISPPFPETLAATGAFADAETLTPHAGVVPYEVNVPFWSDNAIKSRWFSIPNTNLTMGFNAGGNWAFPTGAVWIQHFELELTNGAPESRRRLETRFIVKNAGGVYGVTYRWGADTSNATLVPEEGMEETFLITEDGTVRAQVWHYPGRSECLACHTAVGGGALGFNTAQLNREFDYSGTNENQIRALSQAGYFSAPVTNIHTLRRLAAVDDESVSLEYRVRSYLAANCAQCHRPGGLTPAFWDARITTPTSAAGLINGPLSNPGGDPANRVIVPGDLMHSMLRTRIVSLGPDRMPPLASNVSDSRAINLLSSWIVSDLADFQSFADWQISFFGSTNAPDAAPDADVDFDGENNFFEWLTGTVPTNSLDVWTASLSLSNGTARIGFEQIANRAFEVFHATNLTPPVTWLQFDAPGNTPSFPATNRPVVIEDTTTNGPEKYYRVRVSTP